MAVLRQLQDQAAAIAAILANVQAAARDVDTAYQALGELAATTSDAQLRALSAAYASAQAQKAEAKQRIASLDGATDTALRERLDAQPFADRENVPGSRLNAQNRLVSVRQIFAAVQQTGRSTYRARLAAKRGRNEIERHRSIGARAADALAADEARQQYELRAPRISRTSSTSSA
jgi:hypothetical protein